MMMPHMDITRVSLGQEEKFVYETGMDQAAQCTVQLGMTPWRVTLAISRGKKFVCGTGTVGISATFIASRLTIQTLVTIVAFMVIKYVYQAGMVHLAIARQGMIRPWVTSVTLPAAENIVLEDGSVSTATSIVYQEMIQQVITLATAGLELKSVFPTGSEKTVLFSARLLMILWVDKSAHLTEADFVPETGMVQDVAFTVPLETTKRGSTLVILRQGGRFAGKTGMGTTAPRTAYLKKVIGLAITTAVR